MIELIDDPLADKPPNLVKILDHSARRAIGSNRPLYADLERIRMAMHARAFSGMKWQHVSCFEAETSTDLHRRRQMSSKRAPGTHLFETLLEVGEETTGDVAVDHTMIERQTRVHHLANRD